MKPAIAVAVILLSTSARLRAGEASAPLPMPPGATEVTIDRKDQFLGGVGFGAPIGLHATIGLLHGLSADVREDRERVKAVCAFPIARCARGFLLEAGAGSGGGRLSLGLGGHARVESEDFHGIAGAALKLSLARTWGRPLRAERDLTYLGPELDLTLVHVGINLGLLFRVSGKGGSSMVVSWGLGGRL